MSDMRGGSTVAGYVIVHAGNILDNMKSVGGAGSGLDADKLGGMLPATANNISTVVSRDASGNFSAGTITANLTGHASLDLALTGGTLTGNLTVSNSAPVVKVSNSGGSDVIIEMDRGANANWRFKNSSGVLSFESDYNGVKGAYYNGMTLTYSSGDMWVKGNITAPSFIGNASTATKLVSNPTTFSGYSIVDIIRVSYIVLAGGLLKNVSLTLPSSKVYKVGKNNLRVVRDGITQRLDTSLAAKDNDYWEMSTTQIRFNYSIPVGSIIDFEILPV